MSFRAFVIVVLLLASATAEAGDFPRLLGYIRSDTSHAFFGNTIVPIGDQNNDGYDDFVSWDSRAQGYVFRGATVVDTTRSLIIDDSLGNGFTELGDLNGDGFVDIVGRGRVNGKWKTQLYYGGPSMDGHRDAWFGLDGLYGARAFACGCDLNANGSPEIFAGSNIGDEILGFEVTTPPDTNPAYIIWPANLKDLHRVFGRAVITGDFNGDDTTDLVVSLDGDGYLNEPGHIYVYWGGVGFDTIPDVIFSRPGGYIGDGSAYFGWIARNLGDISGDGWDDFVVGTGAAGSDILDFIYFGGPFFDTLPDVVLDRKMNHIKSAEDLNSDGYTDFLTAFELPFPSRSDVSIYLGGPDLDSIPDVVFHDGDIAGFHIYLGRDIAGIGDYNGDGTNDFAFSAEDSNYRGIIYIYSGWSGTTDVIDETASSLPDEFTLHQNCPNPFNPSTEIRFTLSRRCHTRLEVFDPTGRLVTTLLDRTLSTGEHTAVWDATDFASGVYLYRLTMGDQSDSRKMVLVR